MPNGNDVPANDATHVTNFIRNIVEADLVANKFATRKWAGKPGLAAAHAAQGARASARDQKPGQAGHHRGHRMQMATPPGATVAVNERGEPRV